MEEQIQADRMTAQGRIDLHVHSTASDGTMTPTQVVEHAKKIGLSAIALTDHDTMNGLEEFMQAGRDLGMDTVRGTETAVVVDDCDVHLICLFFDPTSSKLIKEFEEMAASRANRNYEVIDKLRGLGYRISREEVEEFGKGAVTRGHIGQVLKRNHYPDMTPQQIVKTYLDKGQIGYVRRRTPDPKVIIDAMHEAGALVFTAHLNQIDRKDPAHCIRVFEMLAEMGVDGLETRYCEYDDYWRKTTDDLADKYGMLRSGGSDYHGTIKPDLFMGVGYGDLVVPPEYLAEMRRELRRRYGKADID